MKNLLITTAILLLMTMGMVYDQDCRQYAALQRRAAWACEDGAYAAAAVLRHGEKSKEEAEAVCGEILEKNMGKCIWQMEVKSRKIQVEADFGEAAFRLPFLKGMVHLTARGTCEYSEIFSGKKDETS